MLKQTFTRPYEVSMTLANPETTMGKSSEAGGSRRAPPRAFTHQECALIPDEIKSRRISKVVFMDKFL